MFYGSMPSSWNGCLYSIIVVTQDELKQNETYLDIGFGMLPNFSSVLTFKLDNISLMTQYCIFLPPQPYSNNWEDANQSWPMGYGQKSQGGAPGKLLKSDIVGWYVPLVRLSCAFTPSLLTGIRARCLETEPTSSNHEKESHNGRATKQKE